jgi:hypothetical protein
MLVTLLAQFLLGMAVNLFVDIPRNHPGANPPEYFSGVIQSVTWAITQGPLLLVLHAVLGLIVLAGSISFAVLAIRSGPRSLAAAAVVGALAVLIAGFNGGSFLNYNEDFSSMIMAIFFAIAVGAYAWALSITAAEPSRA